MAELCTQAELEIHMHADFGVDPEPAVTQLIESASALIESAAGQPLTEAAVTDELHSGEGYPSLWTERTPVKLATAPTVTEDGETLAQDTDYKLTSVGRCIRLAGAETAPRYWTAGFENITISYTGGPAAIPDLARSICLEVVARAFKKAAAWANAPDMAAFLKRIKLDTDEAEFREEVLDVAGTSIELVDAEMEQLAYLRRPVFA